MELMRKALPLLAGIVVAVLFALSGTNRDTAAIVLLVATTCYLAAAALGRQWVAWVTFPLGSIAVAVALSVGPVPAVGIAALVLALVTVGVVRRSPLDKLGAETLAYLGYGGVALAALSLTDAALGAVVAAVALAAHAVWDAVHLVRDRGVVPPALAWGCIGLDTVYGAVVVVAVTV